MIRYIKKGDIFALDNVFNYAHGCNCVGAMGKGIALQFRNKYPEMYQEYKLLCQTGEFKPGDVFDYNYGKGHIYNLATQLTWRSKAKVEYINSSLLNMLNRAEQDKVKSIALPAIGAGLGGLLWEDVKKVINNIATNYPNIDLYIVESYYNPLAI